MSWGPLPKQYKRCILPRPPALDVSIGRCSSLWLPFQALWITQEKRQTRFLFVSNMMLWGLFLITSRSVSLEWAPAGKSRIIYLTQPLGHPSGGKASRHRGHSSGSGIFTWVHTQSLLLTSRPEAPSFSTRVKPNHGRYPGQQGPRAVTSCDTFTEPIQWLLLGIRYYFSRRSINACWIHWSFKLLVFNCFKMNFYWAVLFTSNSK